MSLISLIMLSIVWLGNGDMPAGWMVVGLPFLWMVMQLLAQVLATRLEQRHGSFTIVDLSLLQAMHAADAAGSRLADPARVAAVSPAVTERRCRKDDVVHNNG